MTTKNTTGYDRGDWIVHCYHGVGQIEDIERKQINDQENTYFRLRTIDSTIWIPIDQIDNEQIRPISNRTNFQEAVEVLNNQPREMASNLSTRNSRINRVIAGNIPIETARLIRDLRARRRSKRGLNQGERNALRDLTKRFVLEWAVCKGVTIEQATRRLNNKLDEKRVAVKSHSGTTLKDGKVRKKSSLLKTLAVKQAGDSWAERIAQ